MNEIQDEYREYKKLCRVEDDPGVSGLAQLGRNAIDRVSELERELAERDAEIVRLGTALISAERERDAIRGDYDEAAHFARHFIRDDPNITPRGAIIRLGDKCTDMFCRLQQAEARLAAIESAPTVAMLCPLTESAFNESTLMTAYQKAKMPHVELIARPAKD